MLFLPALVPLSNAAQYLPGHLSHGSVARGNPQLLHPSFRKHVVGNEAPTKPVFLDVPLDHFDPNNKATTSLHYFISPQDPTPLAGPIFVNMAGEGSVSGCYSSSLAVKFKGLSVCPEHR